MLDSTDKLTLFELFERSIAVPGFNAIVGPTSLYNPAIEELERLFLQNGKPPGQVEDLTNSNEADVEYILSRLNHRLYMKGLPGDAAIMLMDLRRDAFVRTGSVLIFLLTPNELMRFSSLTPAIWTYLQGRIYAVGSQRTLDAMGDHLQMKLLNILDRIDAYQEKLTEAVTTPRSESSDRMVILRRWNSFSPIISRRPVKNTQEAERLIWSRIRREIRGGGYLILWKDHGVAVDPGHNFIENLYEQGYTIADLDSVVISHDHLDHTADFEPILDLIYQTNKRSSEKSISVYLNPTTHRKYRSVLNKNSFIKKIKMLPIDGSSCIIASGIRLFALHARHRELGASEKAVSLRFELTKSIGSKRKIRLGLTCDTGWHAGLADFFQKVDVIIPHIGSIRREELERAEFYQNHLGILGIYQLLSELNKHGTAPCVILSEFGEELMGLRDVLADELNRHFPEMGILPGDIGHTIELGRRSIRVLCCRPAECGAQANHFFEQDGEIRLLCDTHKPTVGQIQG